MKNSLLYIENYIDNNYWTNYLGLARTFLALSTLLTLLFNNTNMLYLTGLQYENSLISKSYNLSIYTWFPEFIYGYWISVIVLIVTILGVFPKITCIPHWIVSYSFFQSSTISDGGDQIASLLTFLIIPICLLDKRKNHWSTLKFEYNFYEKSIACIFYELTRFQVFIIYFFASIGKFSHNVWQEGTALYYWFNEPLFGLNNSFGKIIDLLIKNPVILTFLTWSVLILELGIAFSYFLKKDMYKLYALYVGVFFHLLIALFFGLISFFFVMFSALILFLISKNNNYEIRNFNFINSTNFFNTIFSFSSKKN